MNNHDVLWTQPPALLTQGASRLLRSAREAVERPVILRFQHDAFMQEFMTVLDTQPGRLREYEVRRETWRGFTPSPVIDSPAPESLVLRRLGLIGRRSRPTAEA